MIFWLIHSTCCKINALIIITIAPVRPGGRKNAGFFTPFSTVHLLDRNMPMHANQRADGEMLVHLQACSFVLPLAPILPLIFVLGRAFHCLNKLFERHLFLMSRCSFFLPVANVLWHNLAVLSPTFRFVLPIALALVPLEHWLLWLMDPRLVFTLCASGTSKKVEIKW